MIANGHSVIVDASESDDLVATVRQLFSLYGVVAIRGLKGAQGGRLTAYEYTNLIRRLGRIWTTGDELAAESRFQLQGYPEIIKLQHDGLLGSKALPLHSDASHHPSRPWPYRSLLPVVLPDDGSATTSFYDTYAGVEVFRDYVAQKYGHYEDGLGWACWHQPAYGTDWAGRWNRFVELHPRTGREFLSFDDLFIKRIRYPVGSRNNHEGVEMTSEEVMQFRKELKERLLQELPVYEHVWEPSDLVIWDNRAVLHSRTRVTEGKPREMWRITFDLLG